MKIERRDVYSFLIAVFVVTITSIIQLENPIPDEPQTTVVTNILNTENLAALKHK